MSFLNRRTVLFRPPAGGYRWPERSEAYPDRPGPQAGRATHLRRRAGQRRLDPDPHVMAKSKYDPLSNEQRGISSGGQRLIW